MTKVAYKMTWYFYLLVVILELPFWIITFPKSPWMRIGVPIDFLSDPECVGGTKWMNLHAETNLTPRAMNIFPWWCSYLSLIGGFVRVIVLIYKMTHSRWPILMSQKNESSTSIYLNLLEGRQFPQGRIFGVTHFDLRSDLKNKDHKYLLNLKILEVRKVMWMYRTIEL